MFFSSTPVAVSGSAPVSKQVTVTQPYIMKPTSQLPFPSTYSYSSGGYSGTLSAGNAYVVAGSAAGSINASYTTPPQSSQTFPGTYSYNDGTYSGTLLTNGSPQVASGQLNSKSASTTPSP